MTLDDSLYLFFLLPAFLAFFFVSNFSDINKTQGEKVGIYTNTEISWEKLSYAAKMDMSIDELIGKY